MDSVPEPTRVDIEKAHEAIGDEAGTGDFDYSVARAALIIQRQKTEKLVSALRIIHIWATIGELEPKRVASLCKKTLGTKTMFVCKEGDSAKD